MSNHTQQDMFELLDFEDFNERIIRAYNDGSAEMGLPADISTARSVMAPGTGRMRDFSYIAPEIPIFFNDNCVGCMECVTSCPDTAILGKVLPKSEFDSKVAELAGTAKDQFEGSFSTTKKFYNMIEKKGGDPGMFGIFVDPTKCKGCGECVEVCDDEALAMQDKSEQGLPHFKETFDIFKNLPDTSDDYINEKVLSDMMLKQEALDGFVGGAGACMGCGEVTCLRMMLAATNFVYGPESLGMVAATGCNTVYASTYPYNPYTAPWMNSLFENCATTAAGVRLRWDQSGRKDKKLWAIGGDGGMLDIGFQALSRVLTSDLDINVMVLDTQVYSNTGGQTSGSTFFAQESKLSAHGKVTPGKVEMRKEAAQIAMMHPNVFVACVSAAFPAHFYRAIMAANEYEGPSLIIAYTTCQPEHGVGDEMSNAQSKLAVESRTFPLLVHDPREGKLLRERLSLKGNPKIKEDWMKKPKTDDDLTFVDFARTEGRFRKHFDKDGNPSEALMSSNEQRLDNWRRLQERAGVI